VSNFLICYHLPANSGYAIEPLEVAFYEVATGLVGSCERVHLGYKNYEKGTPLWLNNFSKNLIAVDYKCMTCAELEDLASYIRTHDIKTVLAFDLPVGASICKAFRKGGVEKVFSYFGAPMSALNTGLKLFIKRLEVLLTHNKPDHYIFESFGMQDTATRGRGISSKDTSVVRLGIDFELFHSYKDRKYVYKEFDIPPERKIIFYAGHMEKRKGVDVIIKAATVLLNERGIGDMHFLICGNRPGEEEIFRDIYINTASEGYITFGGYRNDIPNIMPGCFAAVIASTGWDSFPRASLEMSAAGLPLLVSNISGLNETVDNERTGLVFPPGDHVSLANKLEFLLKNPETRDLYSCNGIDRIRNNFTLELQKENLMRVIRSHTIL